MVVTNPVREGREALTQTVRELAQKVADLEAQAKRVYDEEFDKESPNEQAGDTRVRLLNMWANIGSLCRIIRDNGLSHMRVCLSVAKDIEKELAR